MDIKPRYILCELPVRYEEDLEEFEGYSFLEDNTVVLFIDIESSKVIDWKSGHVEFYMKVVDTGSYTIYNAEQQEIHSEVNGYVPSYLPNEWGDYFCAKVLPDGTIDGWRTDADEVMANAPIVCPTCGMTTKREED